MSSQDRATLIREVSIVFHVAATVRFDEKLKLAVPINVRSTRDVVNLCKEIMNLKVSFVRERKSYVQKIFDIFIIQLVWNVNTSLILIKQYNRTK